MNPAAAVVSFVVRGLPWVIVGMIGAVTGAAAVRGARSAAPPLDLAGSPATDDAAGGPSSAGWMVAVGPQDLVAGALAGRLLAVVLRPRPVGAFLGGLAAGAAAAALLPAEGPVPAGAREEGVRVPR